MKENKKVLVLGGTGFIGTHITRKLVKAGYQVTVVSLTPPSDENSFPKNVSIVLSNINDISDKELIEMLKGQWGVVFAIGADDRVTPKAPAYEFYYKANVETCRRFINLARKASVRRAVILSSYFLYFDKKWPGKKLSEVHPYIRSRREQVQETIKAAGKDLCVNFLELPYIFGTAPGMMPMWKPLIKYIKKFPIIFYTKGGTNMMSVKQVGQACTGALEKGKCGKEYVLGDTDLTWIEFIQRLSEIMNIKRRVITVPNFITRFLMFLLFIKYKLQGKEAGLHPLKFVDIQTKNTFYDSTESMRELGYKRVNMDEVFRETIEACRKK